jgi:hypothetical protein
MNDMHAHAKKIRSDAAECLMLSNLVTEERRHLFARIAEHLNSLALEIETETTTSVADLPIAINRAEADVVDHEAAPTRHAPRSWRRLSLPLLVILIAAAGAFVWAMNRTEIHSFSLANLLPKTNPAPHDLKNELATILSDQTNERKAIRDQLSAVTTRLDDLLKGLNELKSLRAAAPAPSIKATAGQEGPSLGAGAKPPAADESGTGPETSSPSSSAHPAAPEATASAPPAASNPAGEPSDQVGTIPPARAELDPRKLTTGPAGCMHFRSFDPVSGTYTTFDGRRRPCR